MKTLVKMRGLDLNRFSTLGGHMASCYSTLELSSPKQHQCSEGKKKKKKTRVFLK